ncbi:hypothetical protein CTAYLR_005667 [Chrysophaeum taylorii]|uniref:Uncharacterized protein n=1 Tax=Chrysophaeum taylorii TaxID=2483200 RepID=A0AAD7ULX9_9STRA|nr:hypothetical protein CTAYLR_005667 [Chrysophaeum taylorii]
MGRRFVVRRGSKQEVLFCAFECKYECVTEAALELGWRIVGEDNEACHVYWVDVANINERMSKLQPWQRINHFPGMSNIARKNRLAQNLEKMRREFPKEYGFYPRTWVLPLDFGDFRAQFDARGKSSRFFIVKPDSGCQGRGIFLTQSIEDISPLDGVVAQHYVRKPFLLDGFKFDLRLYVLVTSCKPLRMYLCHDGLVRLCTEAYTKPTPENAGSRRMHLTNYAINKHSDKFERNEAGDLGSKRSVRWFMEFLAREMGQAKADALWRRMGAMCVKVVVAILPILVREYEATFFKVATDDEILGSRCVEVLGIDVIIDHALKPWLVEINHLPSFSTDSSLDADVKSRVVEQAMSVFRAKPTDRAVYEAAERAKAEDRLYAAGASEQQQQQQQQQQQRRRRLEEIFQRHDPDKLAKVEGLLRKYVGREDRLLHLVERRSKPHAGVPSYAAQIKFAFSQDEKKLKRLFCPLRHHKGDETLPPLEPSDGSRVPWGNPFKRTPARPASLPERKPLPMPGQKQIDAANRLARGFSSARHRDDSAIGCVRDAYAAKVASVVAHAKDWRRRLDDVKHRRNVAHVALQPKTFVFTDTPPIVGGGGGNDEGIAAAAASKKKPSKGYNVMPLDTLQSSTPRLMRRLG